MSPLLAVFVILVYFSFLIFLSRLTAGNTNSDFFIGGRKSNWVLVSFGMISASLSGVTFISVPGWIMTSDFSYMQMVIGYVFGYLFIIKVLLPVYYKFNLTSIYEYFDKRFGAYSYKTAALLFIFSRIIGASFRLFLVAGVLQIIIFDTINIPFEVTVIVTILLIWLYTYKGGIKTIIFTDAIQTLFMLSAAIATVIFIFKSFELPFDEVMDKIIATGKTKVFVFDNFFSNKYHFVKQFIGGMFITIVMTGMDQDMMQKNLSCPNLRDSQKNVLMYSLSFIPVNLLFLFLGVLLFLFASTTGISLPTDTDDLFPLVATQGGLPVFVAVLFLLGLVAAAYSSADSALTSLTTSITLDVLNGNKMNEEKLHNTRKKIHIIVSVLLAVVIIIFSKIKNTSVVDSLFTIAGYTYGPLLGMFSFGLFTKRKIELEKLVPIIALVTPLLSFIISIFFEKQYNYVFGFELLLMNGILSFIMLWILSMFKNNTSFINN